MVPKKSFNVNVVLVPFVTERKLEPVIPSSAKLIPSHSGRGKIEVMR
ncbi:hypothetical protein [Ligilactobacillus murinus]|nr:hypothetical protein [Ligilactobacillus murinus]